MMHPLSQLSDPSLLKTAGLVGGEWVAGDQHFVVTDPATGQQLAEVANLTTQEASAAITAARDAWPRWRAKSAKERGAIMLRWFELLVQHADDLARILTAEQGKPLAEATREVSYGASVVERYAEEVRRTYGDSTCKTSSAHEHQQ